MTQVILVVHHESESFFRSISGNKHIKVGETNCNDQAIISEFPNETSRKNCYNQQEDCSKILKYRKLDFYHLLLIETCTYPIENQNKSWKVSRDWI